ncbi:cytochrome b [Roseospira goensis]|uniref:Cytochrome b561 n=1 Tax=Roseospira goensis TaxID=391922 RepID=A0A7W6RZZ9_9PROT|nr:cytochrome b [Roseospira goensis]MBB4286343.1 cytochrome b561 [Roseospira goensis]
MRLTDSKTGYGLVTIINHWAIAVLMLGLIAFGLILEGMPRTPDKGALVGLHKSLGVLALALALVRIGWRAWQPAITPFAHQPRWEPTLARAMHLTLIAATILIPLSGVLSSVFGGRDLTVFGLFTIPALGEVAAVRSVAHVIHGPGSYLVLALVAGHALVSLKHHFLDRDTTLRRMLTSRVAQGAATPAE